MVNLVFINGSGHKEARPVTNREEYLALRNGGEQRAIVAAVRAGDERQKSRLVQMNYSCLPNDDGTLKGTKRIGNTVGMDIDHIKPEDMQPLRERIIQKKDELGLRMLELSARAQGYHLVFKRRPELSQVENLEWVSKLLNVEFDKGAKDITRVFFTTTGSGGDLIYLDDAIFENTESISNTNLTNLTNKESTVQHSCDSSDSCSEKKLPSCLVPVDERMRFIAQGVMKEKGLMESDFLDEGGRHTTVKVFLTGATQLLTKPEMNGVLSELMPEHWQDQNIQQLVSDFYQNYTNPNQRLLKYQEQLFAQSRRLSKMRNEKGGMRNDDETSDLQSQAVEEDDSDYYRRLPKMPQGVKDSIDAVGPQLAMPAMIAVSPVIGMLATGVRLDVHGVKNTLNLIAYVAGDFASGKGSIDPLIEAWTGELKALEKVYQQQEDEWRAKKRAAKNNKEQPEEPKLPIRLLTLNNTVANLAERLANTDGKHAFSFTPEADTVAQKWKSAINDFSVMLRQSYDGSPYDREARSAEAVNVHIGHLLWNVTMCGTPDALYRVVSNYTDGFQSRIAVARTPDNTFAKLEEKPYVLTDRQQERIRQVAHLLPLMQGDVVLPKLEAKGREWVEQVRVESMKSDDKVRARQRFRVCVTAQRMTCCILLCRVAEQLIAKHGFSGAEKELKQHPDVWKTMLLKMQTPQLLDVYDVVADYLMDCALYFFRERIEAAFASRDYVRPSERRRMGKNDSIYERLDIDFGFEGALQHTIGVKGSGVTRNQVHQMLKNWKNQGMIVQTEAGRFRKIQSCAV